MLLIFQNNFRWKEWAYGLETRSNVTSGQRKKGMLYHSRIIKYWKKKENNREKSNSDSQTTSIQKNCNQVAVHVSSILTIKFKGTFCGMGILLPKFSSDREKLLKFEAEGREFSNFWDHLNNLLKQLKVRTIFGNRIIF